MRCISSAPTTRTARRSCSRPRPKASRRSSWSARIGAERKQYLDGFHIGFDNWHSTDSPENTELSQDIYRKLKAAGLIYTKPVEQFYDPVKGMFLADRYIKGECPKCGAKDQYGDACEICSSVYAPTDLKNPYSTLSGAAPVLKTSEHYFFKLSDPNCVAFLRDGSTSRGRLQSAGREQGAGNGSRAKATRRSATGTSRATRPTSASRFPMRRASISTSGWMRRSAISPASRTTARRRASTSTVSRRSADTEQIHFIGKDIIYFHTLFWPAMLKFAGYKVPDNVYVHGFITVSGEKMSKSRGTGIAPLRYLDIGMNPEWLRYYIAAKLNANVEDLDFNPDDFIARVNSDLVGKYINIASRCAGFIGKHFGGRLRGAGADGGTARDPAARRTGARLLRGARVRQSPARSDAGRGRRQPVRRPAKALGARQAPEPRRLPARGVLRGAQHVPPAYHVPQAGAARARRRRGALPRHRADAMGGRQQRSCRRTMRSRHIST